MLSKEQIHSVARTAFGYRVNKEQAALLITPNGIPFQEKDAEVAVTYCKGKGLDPEEIQTVSREDVSLPPLVPTLDQVVEKVKAGIKGKKKAAEKQPDGDPNAAENPETKGKKKDAKSETAPAGDPAGTGQEGGEKGGQE